MGRDCAGQGQGGQGGARVNDDRLDRLDRLTLPGNEWHALSLDFVAGWHKPPFPSLIALQRLATTGTTAVIGWQRLTVTPRHQNASSGPARAVPQHHRAG